MVELHSPLTTVGNVDATSVVMVIYSHSTILDIACVMIVTVCSCADYSLRTGEMMSMKPDKLACFFCPWSSSIDAKCILDEYDPNVDIPMDCPRFDEVRR